MLKSLLHCKCGDNFSGWAPLVLRVALGLVFLMHGYQKVTTMGIQGVSGFLGSLGFPLPTLFAYILAYGELIGGALLIVGLLTHWVAKYDIIVATVALLTVHISKGFFVSDGGYEFILLILAASVSVLITGPGKFSFDEMWLKKKISSAA